MAARDRGDHNHKHSPVSSSLSAVQVGILTVSDSCYNGTAVDKSGENLKKMVEGGQLFHGTVVAKDIIPDEFTHIKEKLLHWSDHLKLDVILTTGGTGLAQRDVTPEATRSVLEKEAPGVSFAMIKGSLEITPLAMLSRLLCGTRGKTLIINLPGSTKGSSECLQIAAVGIPHAVELLRGEKAGVERTHAALQAEGIKAAHSSHSKIFSGSQLAPDVQPKLAGAKGSNSGVFFEIQGVPSTLAATSDPTFMFDSLKTSKCMLPISASIGPTQTEVSSMMTMMGSNKESSLELSQQSIQQMVYLIRNSPQLLQGLIDSLASPFSESAISETTGLAQNAAEEPTPAITKNSSLLCSSLPLRSASNSFQMDNSVSSKFVKSAKEMSLFQCTNLLPENVSSNSVHDKALQECFSTMYSNQYTNGKMTNTCQANLSNTPMLYNSSENEESEMNPTFSASSGLGHSILRRSPMQTYGSVKDRVSDRSAAHYGTISGTLTASEYQENAVLTHDIVSSGKIMVPVYPQSHEKEKTVNLHPEKSIVDLNDPKIGHASSQSNQSNYNGKKFRFCQSGSKNQNCSDPISTEVNDTAKKSTSVKESAEHHSHKTFSSGNDDLHCKLSKKSVYKTVNSSNVAETNPDHVNARNPCPQVPIKSAKIHKTKQANQVFYVDVGSGLKNFIESHPVTKGVALHKGKREIKKQLVSLCRLTNKSETKTSWRRGKNNLERNCFDDYFELTNLGKNEQACILDRKKRDQYVVNWYVWCAGYGNCRRKCGGLGACIDNCKGMLHKQDRHNCSLMLNMKLFISDLSTWRVTVSGSHIPPHVGAEWKPKNQSSDSKGIVKDLSQEDSAALFLETKRSESEWEPTRDVSSSCVESKRHSDIVSSDKLRSHVPTKKRISKMLSALKRRRSQRPYHYKYIHDQRKDQLDTFAVGSEMCKEVKEKAISVGTRKETDVFSGQSYVSSTKNMKHQAESINQNQLSVAGTHDKFGSIKHGKVNSEFTPVTTSLLETCVYKMPVNSRGMFVQTPQVTEATRFRPTTLSRNESIPVTVGEATSNNRYLLNPSLSTEQIHNIYLRKHFMGKQVNACPDKTQSQQEHGKLFIGEQISTAETNPQVGQLKSRQLTTDEIAPLFALQQTSDEEELLDEVVNLYSRTDDMLSTQKFASEVLPQSADQPFLSANSLTDILSLSSKNPLE